MDEQPNYQVFREIAEKFHPRVVFVTGDMTTNNGKDFAEYFGLDQTETHIVAMRANSEEDVEKFIYNREVSSGNLRDWVQEFVDKKLVREFKSEEIPQSNDGPVKVFVGKNFAEEVYRDDKHVLVEFYAPWCGHCQEVKIIVEFH